MSAPALISRVPWGWRTSCSRACRVLGGLLRQWDDVDRYFRLEHPAEPDCKLVVAGPSFVDRNHDLVIHSRPGGVQEAFGGGMPTKTEGDKTARRVGEAAAEGDVDGSHA